VTGILRRPIYSFFRRSSEHVLAAAPGAHALVLLDQAGWHVSTKLPIPDNITLLPLPPKSPELNRVENIWQFMRDNGNRARLSCIVGAKCQILSTRIAPRARVLRFMAALVARLWLLVAFYNSASESSAVSSLNTFSGICSALSKNADLVLISLALAQRARASLTAYAAFSFATKNARYAAMLSKRLTPSSSRRNFLIASAAGAGRRSANGVGPSRSSLMRREAS
jgi:hypothetical protein